jgi:hypothetical protein
MSTLKTTFIQKPGAGTDAFEIPANDGTNGQYLQTNGSGALSWATLPAGGLQRTVLSSTSITGATTFTMTGIGSDAKEVHLFWNGFYTSSGTSWHFRLGTSAGVDSNANYRSHSAYTSSTSGLWDDTIINFIGAGSSPSSTYNGEMILRRYGDTNNWRFVSRASHITAPYFWQTIGNWNGPGTLDRIQWLVAGGTGTINGGTAQIVYYS